MDWNSVATLLTGLVAEHANSQGKPCPTWCTSFFFAHEMNTRDGDHGSLSLALPLARDPWPETIESFLDAWSAYRRCGAGNIVSDVRATSNFPADSSRHHATLHFIALLSQPISFHRSSWAA